MFLEAFERFEDDGTHTDRLFRRQRPAPDRLQHSSAHTGCPEQLVDHPVGDQRLPLLAAGTQDSAVVELGEELVDQRRLADARRPGQQDRLRSPGTTSDKDPPQR